MCILASFHYISLFACIDDCDCGFKLIICFFYFEGTSMLTILWRAWGGSRLITWVIDSVVWCFIQIWCCYIYKSFYHYKKLYFSLHARTMFLQMRAYIVHFLVNWLLLLRPWNWMMVYDGDNFEQVSPVMFLSFTICWEIHFCHFFVCLLAWMLRLSSVFSHSAQQIWIYNVETVVNLRFYFFTWQ